MLPGLDDSNVLGITWQTVSQIEKNKFCHNSHIQLGDLKPVNLTIQIPQKITINLGSEVYIY